jgi:hypothetical protein
MGEVTVKKKGDGPTEPAPGTKIEPQIFEGTQCEMLHEVSIHCRQCQKSGKPEQRFERHPF